MSRALVHVCDSEPGISRRKCGRGFTYIAPDGTTIARGNERARIEALAVPPAYSDVWICAKQNGHLQATGRDARKRKQYRYHPDWSATRASTKYDQLAAFGEALPYIRRRIERDLSADPGDEAFALAAAVMIIDRAGLRVGQQSYSRENGSYGALTLKPRHLVLKGDALELRFTAKGGKTVRKQVTDKKLQRLLHRIHDVQGATLLSWVTEEGEPRRLTSHQLNSYLAQAAGDAHVTAKTFRTWAGTLAAYERAEAGGASIRDLAEVTAARLHNTPAVARNRYIHPAVIDLLTKPSPATKPAGKSGLSAAEQRLPGLLSG